MQREKRGEIDRARQLLPRSDRGGGECVVGIDRRNDSSIRRFDIEAEPLVVIGIFQQQRPAAEVVDCHGGDERLIHHVELALERNIHPDLRRGLFDGTGRQ